MYRIDIKLNKYELVLLKVILDYNQCRGIGTPTLDRLFYKELEQITDLENIYDVRWIPLINNLLDLGLVEKVESGKGTAITTKGKDILSKSNLI